MSAPRKAYVFSRRSLLRLLAALPLFSAFGLAPAEADGFVEIDGWVLKRSDLRRKDRP